MTRHKCPQKNSRLLTLTVLMLAANSFADETSIGSSIEAAKPLMSQTTPRSTPPPPSHAPLRPPDLNWVNTTLAAMTLDQKIGQMIMPGFSTIATAKTAITDQYVTGFLFTGNGNTAADLRSKTNELQQFSSFPLLFSIDCEAGLGARTTDATRFPLNMGAASAGDLSLVRQQGRITARECRAVGIQLGFGPCVDVNTEPINPIIGIRAYSDNPAIVSEYAEEYVRGATEEGLLTSLKHFPGHGAADGDTHSQFVSIDLSLANLRANHIAPYTDLTSLGLGDSVMSAHIVYPQIDNSGLPATLSSQLMTTELRTNIGFTGVALSDSYGMTALINAAGGNVKLAAQKGIQAGLDMILSPTSTANAFDGIKEAVTNNLITEQRISDSVRRILIMKSRAGMPEITTVPDTASGEIVLHPNHVETAEIMARKVPAGRVQTGVLPLNPNNKIAVFAFTSGTSIFYNYSMNSFKNRFQTNFPQPTAAYYDNVSYNMSSTEAAVYALQELNTSQVIIATNEWKPVPASNQQGPKRLIQEFQIQNPNVKIILISFGSPYQINSYPTVKNFICGFGRHYATMEATADILKGTQTLQTDFPVYVESLIPRARVNDYFLY